jgi:uncharacterized protein YndB with AHSA1/START domain
MPPSDVVARPRLQLMRMLAARPQDVFRAWTEPDQLERWCAPAGYEVLDIELELRVGGAYSVVMKHPDETSVCVTGNFLAVAPGQRLAYTCARQGTEMDAGDTSVSVDLRDRSGSTGLVLTHRGFESDEVYDFHEWAWNSCLDQLADLL